MGSVRAQSFTECNRAAPALALTEAQPAPAKRPRLASLDALRGLTILLMLLVNNLAVDGAAPEQLVHAKWNGGVHLADLVFPWFLFCMGLSVPFSVDGMVKRGLSPLARARRVLWRSTVLFFLGCLIDSAQAGRPVFGLDVLQLLALAYLFGSILYPMLWRARLGVAGILLAAYGIALAMIPLPPHGTPAFEETKNVISFVNPVLARFNLAGLLSVVPTTALVLVAATIANLLRSKEKSDAVKLKSLVAAGIALTAAGMAWNEVLPFNKTVWTPSYILLSAGLGSLLLALLFWILDLRKWMWWAFPLVVYGSNALVAYVGPVLLKLVVLQRVKIDFHGRRLSIADAWLHSFTDTLGRVPGGWAYTVSYMLAVWVVLLILYRMKWFVRV